MCLHNVLSIVGFVAALCTYLALLKAWLPYFMPSSPGLRSDAQKHNAQIFQHNLSHPNATCVVKNVSGFWVFLRRHNQTVPAASTVFVKYRRQKEQKLQK